MDLAHNDMKQDKTDKTRVKVKPGATKRTATSNNNITKRKGSKAPKIVAIATEHPELTTREIGKLADCSHVNVLMCLRRYGIDHARMEDYKANRADVLAGLQERILGTITDADIQKTPAIQRITASAILYDKERLERGQANTISTIQAVTLDVKSTLDDLRAARLSANDQFSTTKQIDAELHDENVLDITPENVSVEND
jgi:hypothetical protein